MMDLFLTLEAVGGILEMGFIPSPANLVEFSAEDYIKCTELPELGVDPNMRWFKLIPPLYYWESGVFDPSEMPQSLQEQCLSIVNEEQVEVLWKAVRFIELVCAESEQPLTTDREMLRYISNHLSPILGKEYKGGSGLD